MHGTTVLLARAWHHCPALAYLRMVRVYLGAADTGRHLEYSSGRGRRTLSGLGNAKCEIQQRLRIVGGPEGVPLPQNRGRAAVGFAAKRKLKREGAPLRVAGLYSLWQLACSQQRMQWKCAGRFEGCAFQVARGWCASSEECLR